MPGGDRMRILLTAHRFWPSVGGTEEVVERLAQQYAKAGHEVTVFTSDEPGRPAEETRDGYAIRRFALRRRGRFRFPPRAYRDAVLSDAWDVVHLHGQRVWSTDYLYRHLPRAKAPVVFTAHGFYQWHMERLPVLNDYYYRWLLPRSLRHAAAVTALTSPEMDELRAWGVPDGKLRLIPDGFDPSEFATLPAGFRARHGIAPGEPLLLYVGGFYRNKRVDRLVGVAAETGATLAVIGKEADARHGLAECRALAERTGAKVRFLGKLPREYVLAGYAESDLFLLGSDFEGFGLVLLEAMAAGLPFVATRAGAAPDLAAHGAGLSVEPARMAAEVRALLDDPARRKAMGEAGRKAVTAYEWGPIAAQYLRLYQEVARR